VGKPAPDLVTTFETEVIIEDPELGSTREMIPLSMNFYDAGGLGGATGLPELEGGECQVWGTLHMDTDQGTFTVPCKSTPICFQEPPEDDETVPKLTLSLVTLTASKLTESLAGAAPGVPVLHRFKLKNHSDATFEGAIQVTSDNLNEQASWEPAFDGAAGWSHNLSVGDGDDFPMEVYAKVDVDTHDPCFALPTPESSISPTASLPSIVLVAGDEIFFHVYTRSWGLCADGSCSRVVIKAEGDLTGGTNNNSIPVSVCSGTNVIVEIEVPPPSSHDPYDCPDNGEASYVMGCGDEDGDGVDDCYEYLVRAAPFPDTLDGLILTGQGDGKLVVLLSQTDTPDGFSSRVVDTHLVEPNLGRMHETLVLSGTPAPGDRVELTARYILGAGSPEGVGTIREITMGAKFGPNEFLPHSVIGSGEVLVVSEPYAIYDLMGQESLWAVDSTTGLNEEVPIEDVTFTVEDNGYSMSLAFDVPDFGPTTYLFTHDFRAFARTDFEVVCEDGTDNDNDGDTDCDDSDCDKDPVCQDDTGTENVPDSGDDDAEDDKAGGCGCSQGTNPATAGWMLVGLAMGLRRRRR
jgi:MYXO-CTERM domain-containing protein